MDERPIKTLLDLLPEYLNFAIAFLRSPRQALAAYELKGRVHVDLTSFLFAGVGAAYLAVLLLPVPGLKLQAPEGAMDRFALWLTQQDVRLLPLEALLAVLALALLGHLVAKLFDRWEVFRARLSHDDQPALNFPGTAEDSMNAALGFAAVMLPLATLLLLGVLALATSRAEAGLRQDIVVVTSAGALALFALVAVFYYLVLSFAAVHKVSYGRAASALAAAYICLMLLVQYFP